ncbi:MAG: hypothetical protein OEV94_07150 [Deltaproteobacteria bacterium]|nr:hypothetical protein [Deltaproteobacteria bacterium]
MKTKSKGLSARIRAAWVGVLLVGLSGCLPNNATFDAGFSTTQVDGTLTVGGTLPDQGETLIVAIYQQYRFVNLEDAQETSRTGGNLEAGEKVTAPIADIIWPDEDGRYRVEVPTNTVGLELYFIAPGHLSDQARFRPQIGVGAIHYPLTLTAIPDWRNHFYTFVDPFLASLITEKRYHLGELDQKRLGDWLEREHKRLEAPPKPTKPSPAKPGK